MYFDIKEWITRIIENTIVDDDCIARLADEIEKRFVPRPMFEDGEVVKIGDYVDGLEDTVISYHVQDDGLCTISDGMNKIYECGSKFVNRPIDEPVDTFKKINNDVKKFPTMYWRCHGISCDECKQMNGISPLDYYYVSDCSEAQMFDLLRRQRKLLLEKGLE